jgi:hypothetical protein
MDLLGDDALSWEMFRTYDFPDKKDASHLPSRNVWFVQFIVGVLRLKCRLDREVLNTAFLKGGKSLIDQLLRGLLCKVREFEKRSA